jgi:hypothetical protein
MRSAKLDTRGFTLIASLLLTLLLSGVAITLLMMVNTEQRVGAADLDNNYTYRAAEGGMENLTSSLANTFQSIQSPQSSDICNSANNPPTYDATVTYSTYTAVPVNPGVASPCSSPLPAPQYGPIQSGPDSGLYAQLIPVTLNVTATRLGNSETVSMTRTAEVALIPVFQFGVFSDSDLFFGQSPNMGFGGRVHTNGDLYLGVANGDYLVFGDKMAAFGNVIREQMQNQFPAGNGWDQGTVIIPNTSGGCATQLADLVTNPGAVAASASCVNIAGTALGATNGSVVNGHGSAQVGAAWSTVSTGTYANYLIDGNGTPPITTDGPDGTGATDLVLPFVQGTTTAYEIIRRPLATDNSLLSGSRLANEAQIRILLSDKEADLHLPGWNGDATQDVELASLAPEFASTAFSQNGITVNGNIYYFGEAACGSAVSIGNVCAQGDPNFVFPPWVPGGAVATHYATQPEWPLINGWLLVEVQNQASGLWVGVTKEWLGLGFARGVNVPIQPGSTCAAFPANSLSAQGCNALADHKNAILYFQITADRNGDGSVTNNLLTNPVASRGDETSFNYLTGGALITPVPLTYSGANSQYNWYPINLYDAREGEVDDENNYAETTGTPNGVMNVVELDVGNLKNWLAGTTGATGTTVNYISQNGYILYFSDRRGEQYNPAFSTTQLIGEYGFEDTVNYVNAGNQFKPNGALEPVNYNGVSPEDVNGNGVLDNYGVKTVGDAFGLLTTTDTDTSNPPTPYAPGHRINTYTIGRANRVTGARHALKLVDGSMGNLPTMPPGNANNNCVLNSANPTGCGGFTVASENPVYILGNYNSNCPQAGARGCTTNNGNYTNANYDPTWTNSAAAETPHAAASIMADGVTMLSNQWQDAGVSTTYLASGSQITGSLENPISLVGENENLGGATPPNRMALTTYYRVAVASGKTIAFTNTTQTPEFGFGTDGGVHNFLRYLEDWFGYSSGLPNGNNAQQQFFYKGSIVSLYWNQYSTGTYKCCNLVYTPPDRQYTFDNLFSTPTNLPPGTPMFRNVDNLSYRQNQIARQN